MKISNDKLGSLGFKKISPPVGEEQRAPVAPREDGGEVAKLQKQLAAVVVLYKEERAKRLRLAELLRPFVAQVQAAKTPGRAYRSDGGAAPATSTALAAPKSESAARVPDEVLPPEQELDAEDMMDEGDDPSDDLEGLLDS
jgi:hypothetical protein